LTPLVTQVSETLVEGAEVVKEVEVGVVVAGEEASKNKTQCNKWVKCLADYWVV
jgi:hypothetical protein